VYLKLFCTTAVGVLAWAVFLYPESTLALQCMALLAFLTATFLPTIVRPVPSHVSLPARKAAL